MGALWYSRGHCSMCKSLDKLAFTDMTKFAKPFTADFPRADINETISPDILHQLIKGGFKDHLVTWVEELIRDTHPKKDAQRILDEIDYR